MRRFLAVLAFLAIGSTFSPMRASAKAPALAPLNVQLADLPAGTVLFFEEHPATASAAAKVDSVKPAIYVQMGVLRADDRVYVGGTKQTQVVLIAAIYAIKSATAAHGFYLWEVRKATGKLTRTPLKLIGDEGMSFSGTDTQNKKAVPAYAILFRRGSYLVELAAEPVTKTFSPSAVTHLAQLVDNRIQSAH